MSEQPELVSKGEYARMRGVTAAAVSQWISSGKLTARSLEGAGRSAKIRVADANAELGVKLDPAKQLAQSKAKGEAPADDDNSRYNRARADKAEHENELARRRLAETDGRYLPAAAVRAEWSRWMAGFLRDFEALQGDLAQAIARETGADERAVLTVLRQRLRDWRSKRSATAQTAAEALPELVSDPEPPEDKRSQGEMASAV